ncbi:hypothetical protein BD779DRAFT_199139 [Infundibulicybe gibba]|nr:hypothetical protein BD779DRAFT_199139 [Infundibulicybe gibba]
MTYEAENESESPKSARCISVDIPSDASTSNNTSANTSANTSSSVSSSVSSSLAPSPAGILESRQSTTSTTSLPTPSLNVKFAPLPELAPRKRRSLAPLGVASRSQLMRRRRGYDRGEPPMPTNPMWTDEETRAVSHRQPRRQSDEELEDPFVALGKMVKGASKQLWRKVSNKEKEGKGEKDAKPVDGGGMDEKVDANNEPRQGTEFGKGRDLQNTLGRVRSTPTPQDLQSMRPRIHSSRRSRMCIDLPPLRHNNSGAARVAHSAPVSCAPIFHTPETPAVFGEPRPHTSPI